MVINDDEDDSDNDHSRNNNSRSQYLLRIYFAVGIVKSASYNLSHKKKKNKNL